MAGVLVLITFGSTCSFTYCRSRGRIARVLEQPKSHTQPLLQQNKSKLSSNPWQQQVHNNSLTSVKKEKQELQPDDAPQSMIHEGRGVIFLTPVAIRERLALPFPRTLGEAGESAQQLWAYVNTRWSRHVVSCPLIILLSVCVCEGLISRRRANLLFTRIFLSQEKKQRADREVSHVWLRFADKFWPNCCNSERFRCLKKKSNFIFYFLS